MSDTVGVPYTLAMGLLWFGVAFVIGLGTGVVLRSVVARRQIAAARDGAEIRRLRQRISELTDELGRVGGGTTIEVEATPASDASPPPARPVEHAAEAAADDAADDLTRVDGIGPAVRELCEGVGIVTFEQLASTEIETLRTMLVDAGARYQVHDPTSWPEQARLLADGRLDEFEQLVATIRGERSSDPGPGR